MVLSVSRTLRILLSNPRCLHGLLNYPRISRVVAEVCPTNGATKLVQLLSREYVIETATAHLRSLT